MRLPTSPPAVIAHPTLSASRDHEAGVRFSLLLVGVQDGGRQAAVEHAGELPRQVHCVAQAGAHALADERRSEVGGVAEQEDVSSAPPVGDLRAKGVLGHPNQLRSVGWQVANPRRDERAQRVEGGVSRQRSRPATAGTPSGSGNRRCACRSRRGSDRRLGARRPTDRDRRSVAMSTTSQRWSNFRSCIAAPMHDAHDAVGAVAPEDVVRLDDVLGRRRCGRRTSPGFVPARRRRCR